MTLRAMQDTSEEIGMEEKLGVKSVNGGNTWEAAAMDADDAGAEGRHVAENGEGGGLQTAGKPCRQVLLSGQGRGGA